MAARNRALVVVYMEWSPLGFVSGVLASNCSQASPADGRLHSSASRYLVIITS